jgi:hypothetical protein
MDYKKKTWHFCVCSSEINHETTCEVPANFSDYQLAISENSTIGSLRHFVKAVIENYEPD